MSVPAAETDTVTGSDCPATDPGLPPSLNGWFRPAVTDDGYDGPVLLSAALTYACIHHDDVDRQAVYDRIAHATYAIACTAFTPSESLTREQIQWIGASLLACRVAAGDIRTACHQTGCTVLTGHVDRLIACVWPAPHTIVAPPWNTAHAAASAAHRHLRRHHPGREHTVHSGLGDLIRLAMTNSDDLGSGVLIGRGLHHLIRSTCTHAAANVARRASLGAALLSCLDALEETPPAADGA